MKSIVNGRIIRRRNLILASLITVITSTVILFGDYSTSLQSVSSISSQDQNSARFESALLQQRQKAKSLVRNLSAEERFERLAAKVITDGEVRVIAVLRVAFSPQTEVSKDVESFVQRFEIGRVRELLIDDLIGYDPSSIKRYDVLPILALSVNASGIEALRQSDKILDIQEDQMNQVSQSEGEALIGLAESVPLIGGTKAWASGFTGAGQTVAILDTGVDKNHPMLAGKVVSEACYSTNSGTLTSLCPDGASSSTANNSALPCDSGCEHGTQIAGIAAGKMVSYNGQTFAGVAKDANIIAIQVFSRQNDESICALNKETAPCYRSLTSDYIRGLDRVYSLSRSYSIASANLSLGLEANATNCDSHVTKPIIDLLRVVNIATVIASGNNSYTNAINEPACISTAVSVGATVGESDIVASDSNSASILSLVAPGFGITSAIPRAKYLSLIPI